MKDKGMYPTKDDDQCLNLKSMIADFTLSQSIIEYPVNHGSPIVNVYIEHKLENVCIN